MWPITIAGAVTIAAVLLRRTRWAASSLLVSRITYAAFIIFGLLYFPARTGYRFQPVACEWTFGPALAAHSLTNYAHIVLFVLFFLLTYAQLPDVPKALIWSGAACITMGFLVELAQGVTGAGHCRMRDLIPDGVGALAGAILVIAGRKILPRQDVQN